MSDLRQHIELQLRADPLAVLARYTAGLLEPGEAAMVAEFVAGDPLYADALEGLDALPDTERARLAGRELRTRATQMLRQRRPRARQFQFSQYATGAVAALVVLFIATVVLLQQFSQPDATAQEPIAQAERPAEGEATPPATPREPSLPETPTDIAADQNLTQIPSNPAPPRRREAEVADEAPTQNAPLATADEPAPTTEEESLPPPSAASAPSGAETEPERKARAVTEPHTAEPATVPYTDRQYSGSDGESDALGAMDNSTDLDRVQQLLEQNQREDAVLLLEDLVENDTHPQHLELQLLLARQYLEDGKKRKAKRILRKLAGETGPYAQTARDLLDRHF